jgi:transcriptional regulator with XRE-family HTH domain
VKATREWLDRPGGLAERLQRLRKAAGLTGDQLAAQAGWTRAKVPKIENGRQMPSEDDIRAWAEISGAPEAVEELLAMLAEAQAVHRQWQHKLRAGQAALQTEYDTLVRGAARIRNFEIMLIPGLLQTPDYTRYRALEAVRVHGADERGVETTIAARMRRTEVLYDAAKAFEFVITEAALRYLLCPPPVMLGQLDRLLSASRLPNIKLGIIPPGVELPVAPMIGYMIVDNVALAETFTSMETYTGPEAEKYAEIFDALMAEAVTGDDARRLIGAAADDLRAFG